MERTSNLILNGPELSDRRTSPDRRGAVRKKVLRTGRAQWGRGHCTECIIRNVSELGAQIETSHPLPNKFDLVIGDQVLRACCVMWRRGSRIGVAFAGGLALPFMQATVQTSCRHYAALCREMSQRVTASDRDFLLGMADAWEKMARRHRSKSRANSI
jgi:hypothetical protein